MHTLTRRIVTLLVAATVGGGIAVVAGSAGADPAAHRPTPKDTAAQRRIIAEPNTQTEYVPVAPCVVVDTRKARGALNSGVTREYGVNGSNLAAQGGSSTGCKIPNRTAAVTLGVTTVTPSGTGGLYVYGGDDNQPASRQVSFTKGVTDTAQVTSPLSTDSTFAIGAAGGTTHVAITVSGYYREPIAATVYADGSLHSNSFVITGSRRDGTGQYFVPTSIDVSRCAANVTPQTTHTSAGAYPDTNGVSVYITIATASGSPFYDSDFSITITC